MKKAVIVVFERFTDLDVFLAWDLLNRVKLYENDFQIQIAGTKKSHKSVFGVDLPVDGPIEEANDADLVYFASGPAIRSLIKDADYLKRFSLNPKRQIISSYAQVL